MFRKTRTSSNRRKGSEGLQAETVSLGEIARQYRALKAQAKQKLDLGVPPNAQVTSMAFASEQRVPPAAATSTSQSGPAGTRVEPGASPRPAASSLLVDSFAVQTPSVNPAISRMEADVRPPRLAVPPPIAEQQSPAATSLSERTGNPHRVRAQKGDTLWGLAAKYLGGGEAWPRLAAANPQLARPSLLVAGAWISLPAAPSRSMPQRLVRVERGAIACPRSPELISGMPPGNVWRGLIPASPTRTPDVRIGQLITLPDNCATPSASSIAARLAPEPLGSLRRRAFCTHDPAPRVGAAGGIARLAPALPLAPPPRDRRSRQPYL